MEVWNDLRMLVARYLVASEQMERQGPVAQAVRSVGYHSEEEEEEEEEEEDGSSVEAEEEDEHEHEHEEHEEAAAGGDTEEVPAYESGSAPVEVGPNGYAVSCLEVTTLTIAREEGKSPRART